MELRKNETRAAFYVNNYGLLVSVKNHKYTFIKIINIYFLYNIYNNACYRMLY